MTQKPLIRIGIALSCAFVFLCMIQLCTTNAIADTVYVIQTNYTVNLNTGSNLISCPLVITPFYISTLSSIPNITSIATWNTSVNEWRAYLVGISPSSLDFTWNNDQSYIVYADAPTSITFTGIIPSTNHIVKINNGITALGWSDVNSVSVADMAYNIPGMQTIQYFDNINDRYVNYTEGGNNPYQINPGMGVIIYSDTAGAFNYNTVQTSQHLTKFVTQSLWGLIKYQNVTVSVYDEYGMLQYSQKSDANGQVAFYLSPTSRYNITAVSVADNINEQMSVVPYDETYFFNVWSFFTNWNPFGWMQGVNNWNGAGTGDVNKDIVVNYSVDHDSSPRSILLNYSDATASTTAINFTLLRHWQENGTYTVYNTTLISGSGIGFQQLPVYFTAADADGKSYRIVVTADVTAYAELGSIKRYDSYHFPGIAYPLPGLPESWYPYVAFGIIVLFGLFFTYISTGLGLIVMAFWGTIFMFMGWLTWSDSFLLLLQVLAIFGVGYILKQKKQREGV